MEYNEEDYLMISGLQHFLFCRRQWALIHIEQQWNENFFTTSGEIFHKNAHNENFTEKRTGKIITRGIRVSSHELGISGQCDVVEFISDENGITLSKCDGKWRIKPVEYKRGSEKVTDEDRIQLCAQALCLEEMFLTQIYEGAIYYGETRRRENILIDKELRKKVIDSCREMHTLYQRGYTPNVKKTAKCRSCSLKNVCLPNIRNDNTVKEYIDERIGDD